MHDEGGGEENQLDEKEIYIIATLMNAVTSFRGVIADVILLRSSKKLRMIEEVQHVWYCCDIV